MFRTGMRGRFVVVYIMAIYGCEIDVFTKRPCPSLAEAIMEQVRLRDNTGLRCWESWKIGFSPKMYFV